MYSFFFGSILNITGGIKYEELKSCLTIIQKGMFEVSCKNVGCFLPCSGESDYQRLDEFVASIFRVNNMILQNFGSC
jgi:hypothetical protein